MVNKFEMIFVAYVVANTVLVIIFSNCTSRNAQPCPKLNNTIILLALSIESSCWNYNLRSRMSKLFVLRFRTRMNPFGSLLPQALRTPSMCSDLITCDTPCLKLTSQINKNDDHDWSLINSSAGTFGAGSRLLPRNGNLGALEEGRAAPRLGPIISNEGLLADDAVDLSYGSKECRLDIGGIKCGCLHEEEIFLLSKLLSIFSWDSTQGAKVGLVSNEHDDDAFVSMAAELLEPPSHMIKRLPLGHVIY